MGVIMTPFDGIRKWPYYGPVLLGLCLGGLVSLTFILLVTHTSTSATGHENTAFNDITPKGRQTGPLMAWSGQSDFGYTRVELWKTDGSSYLQDIVIQAAERANYITKKVAIVNVPSEIQIGPDMNTLFVSVGGDRYFDSSYNGVVASTGKDGMLKLFVVGTYRFQKPCDLTPDIGR